jgi:hypothetical protein
MSNSPFRDRTAIIAGCGRSGSTSLFQTLAAHPLVAHSRIKEPGFFLNRDCGDPIMMETYGAHFVDRPGATILLEATSAYFYATPDVPVLIRDSIADPWIILIVREPYARLISEFRYLKTRFLISAELNLEEYVNGCVDLPEAASRKHCNRHMLGVRNGYYDRFFPDWTIRFGERIKVVFFDDLVSGPERVILNLTTWLGLPPIVRSRPATIENRGAPFRAARVQRIALAINDRFEPFFRRNTALKVILRDAYYSVNGIRPEKVQPLSRDHPLRRAYEDSRRMFRAQLLKWDPSLTLPPWLQSL